MDPQARLGALVAATARWFWLAPHLTALILLALLTMRLAANLSFLRRARRLASVAAAPQLPSVSVLVPARNESASVELCAASLLAQRYPNLEVIILDDASTDGTGAMLAALSARDRRLIVLRANDEPPPGWNGKSYACQRLADRAKGDWLLFTDADTFHQPESVLCGVNQALGLDAALVSAFPRQRVQTWSERVLVSFILDFLPLLGVSLTALWRARRTRVAANGQYLLVRADAYHAIGGHTSVAGALVDDFALASRFNACGYSVALVDGGALLTCRMYHNAREVWTGFSKNLMGALTERPPEWRAVWQGSLFAWGYACLFVLPFVHLASASQRALSAIEIGWLLLLRALVAWRLKRPVVEIVTAPLAAWGVMALAMAALFRRARGGRVTWKGRTYSG